MKMRDFKTDWLPGVDNILRSLGYKYNSLDADAWRKLYEEDLSPFAAVSISEFGGELTWKVYRRLQVKLLSPPNVQERDASERDIIREVANAIIETGEEVMLCDLPPGELFMFGETIALKSEYRTDDGAIKAFIVGTGEMFWGGTSAEKNQSELMVKPLLLTISEQNPDECDARKDTSELPEADYKKQISELKSELEEVRKENERLKSQKL